MLPPNQGKQVSHENAGVAPHMPRTARSSILVGYAQLAQSLGLDPASMLDSVGIDRRCLLDREVHIPVIAATQLLERSAVETSVFDFGLRLAEIRGTPDLGPLNPLLREEPNLRRALQSLERYFSVHSTGLAVQIVQAGAPILSVGFIAGELGPTRQSREMIVASLFKCLLGLKGGRWRPSGVCFSHAAPESTRSHLRTFGCPVHFDQDFDGIVLTEEDLRTPIAHANPVLRLQAERYLNTLVTADCADFEKTVRKLIAVLLPLGDCSATTAAQRLGMDRRTLSRRLAHSGQSYTSLLQSVRTDLASHRVSAGGSSLTSLADALGFSSLSAFSHWFQLTFGHSAREWRRDASRRAAENACAPRRRFDGRPDRQSG